MTLERTIRLWAHTFRGLSRIRRPAKWESEAHFLKYVLAADDVCFQCGASDGQYTCLIADRVPAGRVYAFEPSSYTFDVMTRILRLRGVRNATPVHAAVQDQDGTITLTIPQKKTGRLAHSYSFISRHPPGSLNGFDAALTETQPAVSLDSFIAREGIRRCDFIRCDVEGAERLVLEGARRTIETHLPNMMFEIHDEALRTYFDSSAEEVRDLICSWGYRMFRIAGGRVVESRGIPQIFEDVFFLHPERASRLPPGPFRDAMRGPAPSPGA